MKSLMSLVLLTLPILVAAPSRAETRATEAVDLNGRYLPEPFPRSCPEGTHRVFDEYQGRYICVKNEDHGPRPLPWPREDRMKEMSAVLGGDDMSAKGEALNGLFDAMNAGETKGAVAATMDPGRAAPRLIPAGIVHDQLHEAARKAREEFDRRMTEEANRRRDAGDEKLRKGNEDKKKAEEKWPKK